MVNIRQAIFLDRDGTLIHEKNYTKDPADIEFVAGVFPLLRQARAQGWQLVVITNQAGVAQGLMTEAEVRYFNAIMCVQLRAQDVILDGIYFCPHHPSKGFAPYVTDCHCRKPKPGMLLQAARELGIDLKKSWMIGDRRADIEAGWNAGCRSILVKTGYGAETAGNLSSWSRLPEQICVDLAEALDWVAAKDK